MKGRMIGDEGGFTLPEMLVTITIMIVVLFSLYGVFDMSIKVFSFGNNKLEAVENARLGLEKMEREIRAAYPVNGPTGTPRYRFFSANGQSPPLTPIMPTASQITFGNELGTSGDGQITCPNPDGDCEYITYKLTDDTSGAACTEAPCTLRRVNTAYSTDVGQPVVEYVRPPVAGDASRYGLRFRYFTAGGDEINPVSPGSYTQEQIDRVEISLQIVVDDGTQNLTTEANLRNPG